MAEGVGWRSAAVRRRRVGQQHGNLRVVSAKFAASHAKRRLGAGRAPVREIESRAISRDLGVGVDYLARFSSYGMYTDLVYHSDRCLEHFTDSTPGHPTELAVAV